MSKSSPPYRCRSIAATAVLAAVLATARIAGHPAAARSDGPVVDAGDDRLRRVAALQPGVVDVRLTPIADTTIERNRPSAALGGEAVLQLGRQLAPDDDTRSVLLRFGLPEIEPGSLIVTATLTMTRLGAVGQASVAAGLASLSEPFDERTVTWSSRPDIERSGGAAYFPSAPGQQRLNVAWAVEEALRAQRHLGLQLEVPAGGCEAGRSRSFASRESDVGAPELQLAYVGPGTPHPFPSPTPTRTPTPTPTITGTRPPTPTATPTSNRPQPMSPLVFEPAPGAVLPPPVDVDAWVVRWRQYAPTLCSYHIALSGPNGQVFGTDLPTTRATCFTFTTGMPGGPIVLSDGTYRWQLWSQCPPFNGQEAYSPPFELRAALGPTATASAAASATVDGTATATEAAETPTAPATATAAATASPTAVPTGTGTPRPLIYLPRSVKGER